MADEILQGKGWVSFFSFSSLADEILQGKGWVSFFSVSQDSSSEFGKIIELDLLTGESRIVTSGHRSPGGLHRDAAGRLWLTEHGPRGGDELNRVRFGRDYGWPRVTLGTQYRDLTWPGQDAGRKPFRNAGIRVDAIHSHVRSDRSDRQRV